MTHKRENITPNIREQGFTLAELAVVMLIIMLILGGVLIPLGTQIRNKRVTDTQKTLEEIKDALIGFAIVNKRLPRPAESSTVGTERTSNCVDVTCTGFVPWATLGVSKLDAWGKMIRYSVTPSFANSPPTPTITISTAGDKNVKTRNNTGTLVDLATNVPVVILSFGAKNYGTSDFNTLTPNNSITNVDETSNTDGTGNYKNFVSRIPTDITSTAGGEFDDVVTWIPTTILINRMVTAGQLP
jgi:type II secretory pathway pseudopilin PulG